MLRLIALALLSVILCGPLVAHADLQAIKDLIEQTQKDIKTNQDKLSKSNLELPVKESEVKILKRTLNNFNQTTVKQQEDYARKLKDYNTKVKDYAKAKKENQDLYHEQARLEKLLLSLRDDRILEQQKSKRKNHQFVSLVLSEPCIQTHCMTYRDLMQYDTSIQKVSGVIKDNGTDLQRSKPIYKQFWNWYPKNYTAITIDPPAELLNRGAVIMIYPTNFVYAKMNNDPNESIKSGYRLEWSGIRHDTQCTMSFVYANHTLIQRAIQYYKSGCSDPGLVEKKIPMPPTDFKRSDSIQFQEMLKWQNAAKACKTKC